MIEVRPDRADDQGEPCVVAQEEATHSFTHSFTHSSSAASTDLKASLPVLSASSATYPFTSALALALLKNAKVTVVLPQVMRVK